jgi:hypothetical protein
MHTREPEDAVPPEYATPPTPAASHLDKLVAVDRLNFRTSARIVGVHINEDLTELWSHGFNQPHYPLPGARAHVEQRGEYIVFEHDEYELAVKVPSGGRKYARKFAAEFNTFSKRRG